MKITVINGPNLNLLGKRRPEVYGSATLSDLEATLRERFPQTEFRFFQSNSEGELVDAIQKEGFDPSTGGIVINPGAYAHYSIAIADAIEAIPVAVIEVHLSNIHAREEMRHHSVVSQFCEGVIAGLGMDGYAAAVDHLLRHGRQA